MCFINLLQLDAEDFDPESGFVKKDGTEWQDEDKDLDKEVI